MQKDRNFFHNRIKAFSYAYNGFKILITSENSIQTQLVIAIFITIIGFVFNISITEWMFQILAIGIVLVVEFLNSSIEKLADFIHPNTHSKIGIIKDVAAGASLVASITAVIIGLLIYIPKII